MKKTNKLALSVSVAIIAMSTSAVAEVTLYDYTEATSSYTDAYLNGQLNVSDGNFIVQDANGNDTNGNGQTAYDANLTLNYDNVKSTPSRNLSTKFNADGSVSRSSTPGAGSVSNYLLNGSVTMDNYFRSGSKGAFWYGSGEAGIKKGQDKPFSKIGVGLGYGRVVNVTPMAKAIRLVEALQQQGALRSTPSKATYQTIANVIAREAEYQSKFGQAKYEQNWITDIERALVASGQVNGSLSAAGVIESRDVLINERISTRKHGWLIRAGLGIVLSNYDGTDGGDPSLDIGAEYHRPLSNRTQYSNVASMSSIYGDDDPSYRLINNMSLTHEMTDKIDWENTWAMDYSKAGTANANDVTSNSLSSTFRYYLNNQLDVNLTAKASKTDDGVVNNGNDDVDTSLNMGVSYRLK